MLVSPKVRGFTLIELMVAVGIILVMLSILTASFFEARRNSRDRQRVSDLTQIQFALTTYSELNGGYPELEAPSDISRGYIVVSDDTLNEYWEEDIIDPLRDDSDEYEYRIVPELECDDDVYYAVVAANMEENDNSNGTEVCPGESDLANSYVVLVTGPIVPGETPDFDNEGGNEWWNDPENQTWLNGDETQDGESSGFCFPATAC